MNLFLLKHNTPKEYTDYFFKNSLIDFIFGHINPIYSNKRIKAKIVELKQETSDSITIVLRTNGVWKGFEPGQHVPVTVTIEGRRVTRFYSISSCKYEKFLSITVKKQPEGLVSNFLNEKIQVGEILELGEATGNFILLKNNKQDLLFIAGGSGITPIRSMLYQLKKENLKLNIDVLYFSKTKNEIIFYEELKKLQNDFSNLKIHFILTDEKVENFKTSFLNQNLIEELVPNFESRLSFICGPSSLQKVSKELIPSKNLILENFQPHLTSIPKSSNQVKEVKLLKSHKTISVNGEKTILQELEANGIYPPSGCGMGICHTCICKKESGITTDLSKGKTHNENESIQICIHRAETNLELEL